MAGRRRSLRGNGERKGESGRERLAGDGKVNGIDSKLLSLRSTVNPASRDAPGKAVVKARWREAVAHAAPSAVWHSGCGWSVGRTVRDASLERTEHHIMCMFER